MQAVDNINAKFGRHKMYYAAQDLSRTWEPKYQIRSPRYEALREERGPDSLLEPDEIARTYLMLHRQQRSAWTFELDLRPWVERF